jgi:hypothetical protein
MGTAPESAWPGVLEAAAVLSADSSSADSVDLCLRPMYAFHTSYSSSPNLAMCGHITQQPLGGS